MNCTEYCLVVEGVANQGDNVYWAISYSIRNGDITTVTGIFGDNFTEEIIVCNSSDRIVVDGLDFEGDGTVNYNIVERQIEGCTEVETDCVEEILETVKDCSHCNVDINDKIFGQVEIFGNTQIFFTFYNNNNNIKSIFLESNIFDPIFTFNTNIFIPYNPQGNTDITVNIDVKVILENDCEYTYRINELLTIFEQNLINFEPIYSDCTNLLVISNNAICGCTDETALNYDPLATSDDNSCIYEDIIPIPVEIYGCTDILSSNYFSGATINDGSCVYVSGCTDYLASNYNPLAVIDDGSCDCDNPIISFGDIGEFQIPFETINDVCYTGENIENNSTCNYVLEANFLIQFKSDDIINCLSSDCQLSANTQNNIVDIKNFFEELEICTNIYQIEASYSGTTNTISSNNNCLDDIVVISGDVTGETFSLLSTYDTWKWECKDYSGVYIENNEYINELLNCDYGTCCANNKTFQAQYITVQYVLPNNISGKIIKPAFEFKNFLCKFNFLLENIEVKEICTELKERCSIVDVSDSSSNIGFDIERIEDNTKIHIVENGINQTYGVDERLIFNTKEIEFELNIEKYFENNFINYLNNVYQLNITYIEEFLEKVYDVNQDCFDIINQILKSYITNNNNCLNTFSVSEQNILLEAFNVKYLKIIESFIPSTTKWSRFNTIYKNINLDIGNSYCYPKLDIIKDDCVVVDCSGQTIENVNLVVESVISKCDVECVGEVIETLSGYTVCHNFTNFYQSSFTVETLPIPISNCITICPYETNIIKLFEDNDSNTKLLIGENDTCIDEVIDICDKTYVKYLGGGLIELYSENCNSCCEINYLLSVNDLVREYSYNISVGECVYAGNGGTVKVCLTDEISNVIDLHSTIKGDYLTGGTWTDIDNTGLDISDPNSVSITDLESGLYYFEYYVELSGCSDSTIVELLICDIPEVNISGQTEYCLGNTLQLSAITEGTVIEWKTPFGLNYTDNPLILDNFTRLHEGNYIVKVYSECGLRCYGEENIFISLKEPLNSGVDTIVSLTTCDIELTDCPSSGIALDSVVICKPKDDCTISSGTALDNQDVICN